MLLRSRPSPRGHHGDSIRMGCVRVISCPPRFTSSRSVMSNSATDRRSPFGS